MYWNNHDFVSILILYTPNEWKWKFRSLCTDYLVIYSVKKKQSSAFCSFGVRDFFIQTTLLYVRHYALIQKLIPGHKMKTVLMPNSLNSEIINILIYSHYATSSASTSILSICVWTGTTAHDSFIIVSYMYLILKMYFFQIFMNILDKSSEKFKSNQFKTLIIQNR